MTTVLDAQIHRMGFWSVILFLVTVLVSLVLPLDIPDGLHAEHTDRVVWLNENRLSFIMGWVNQMISMLSLSSVFLGMAWRALKWNPLSAVLGCLMLILSVMAFMIPKFIAIWTIPQLAMHISSSGIGTDFANQLLLMLNVSVPFSLYTSFDYLGFWLYGLFGLIVALPLLSDVTSWRIAGVAMGLFGLAFHCLLVMLLMGVIAASDIELWFLGTAIFLIVGVIAAVVKRGI